MGAGWFTFAEPVRARPDLDAAVQTAFRAARATLLLAVTGRRLAWAAGPGCRRTGGDARRWGGSSAAADSCWRAFGPLGTGAGDRGDRRLLNWAESRAWIVSAPDRTAVALVELVLDDRHIDRDAELPHVVVVGGGSAELLLSASQARRRRRQNDRLLHPPACSTWSHTRRPMASGWARSPGPVGDLLRAEQRLPPQGPGHLCSAPTEATRSTSRVWSTSRPTTSCSACGVTTASSASPGPRKTRPPVQRSQALQVRDAMFAELEHAAINGQDRDLRIVVVGGGATYRDRRCLRRAAQQRHAHDLSGARSRPGPHHARGDDAERARSVRAGLRDYAEKALRERDVDLRLSTAVEEVRHDGVVVEKDRQQEVPAGGIVVSASGPHPTVADWIVPRRAGVASRRRGAARQGTRRCLRIGDVPSARRMPSWPSRDPGRQYVCEGRQERLKGKTSKPFAYRDKGTMATIGGASAVAESSSCRR